MFTEDQVDFMHNVLAQETGGRSNLYKIETLEATGTTDEDVLAPPTCIPVADFSADKRMTCVGDVVNFTDASWRAGVTSYEWSFPGGTPSTSTAANPAVVYNQDGYYSVTLTVTNAAGSDTKTFTNMMYISAAWPEFVGPYSETFEGASAGWWHTQNPEENWARFMLIPGVGKGQTKGFKLNNYKDVSAADAYTNDWFYYDRLGNSKDYLISPSFDLSNTSNVSVSFDYVGSTDFTPTEEVHWKTQTFTYTTTAQDTKLRFRFEFIASDKSSNFYFDNFNISGTLCIEENGESIGVSIAPNPVAAGSEVAVEINGTSEDMELQVVDVNGALISITKVPASNGTQTVMIPMNVAKGCYFLNAIKGNVKSTNSVIVF